MRPTAARRRSVQIRRDLIDIVFVFEVDVEAALSREPHDDTSRQRRIMNKPTLSELHRSLRNVTEKFGKLFKKVVVLDTNAYDEDTIVRTIIETTLTSVHAFLEEGVE